MIVQFRLRRGHTDEWAALDPVLSEGEPGVDLDTGALKVGDGITRWLDLPAQTYDPESLNAILAQVSDYAAQAEAAAAAAAGGGGGASDAAVSSLVTDTSTATGGALAARYAPKPTGTQTTDAMPLVSDGAGGFKYLLKPLTFEAFGITDDNGVSDQTAKFQALITAQKARGGDAIRGSAGRFGFKGELDLSLGFIGSGVGQVSGPGASEGKRTVLQALDGTATVRVGPIQTNGSFSVYNHGGAVRDFTIDGGDWGGRTVDLFRVGVVGAREISNVRIDNVGKGSYGWMVWGAQNCKFTKVQVVNGRSGGMRIDYGAGGNTFDTCNTSRVQIDNEGTALLMTESQSSGAPGVYSTSGPSGNKFYNCGFERVQDATLGLSRLLCGLDNTFTDCWWAAGSELTQVNDLVYLGTDITGGATNTKFHNCKWTGGVQGQTLITGIHMATGIGTTSFTGEQSIRQMLNGIRNDGSSGFKIQGGITFTAVTNQFVINAGKGPVLSPAYHLSTGAGLRAEQWVADTAGGAADGYLDVMGPGGTTPMHRIYTRAVTAPPPSAASEAPVYREKPSDTVVNNSTTKISDPHLVLPVAVGTYLLDGDLLYDGSTVAKFAMVWGGPTGVTATWCPNCILSTTTITSGVIQRNNYGYTNGVPFGTAGVGTSMHANPFGRFTFTQAGNLVLTWAQNNIDPTDLTLRAGSWLRLTKSPGNPVSVTPLAPSPTLTPDPTLTPSGG